MSNDNRLTLRLPPELLERIDKVAAAEVRSSNSVVELCIVQFLPELERRAAKLTRLAAQAVKESRENEKKKGGRK